MPKCNVEVYEYIINRMSELKDIIKEDDITYKARVEELLHLNKHFNRD